VGKQLIDKTVDRIRKMTNSCENLQGFIMINAYGGGTGSGFGNLVAERLHEEYAKKTKMQCAILPGQTLSTSIVDPYNCLFACNASVRDINFCLNSDNEACYNICREQLDMPWPSFNHINRLIAQILSSVTCTTRFETYVDMDLTMMQTNLVPYPTIHFPVPSFAPYYATNKNGHGKVTPMEVTKECFSNEGSLCSVGLTNGNYLACSLIYRGGISPVQVNQAVCEIKARDDVNFVDWCPTGVKIGICRQPSIMIPRSNMAQTDLSLCTLCNHTNIGIMWKRLLEKFNLLHEKRAFIHWFVSEGLEEGEYKEAQLGVA
jgi:tubulin alpha